MNSYNLGDKTLCKKSIKTQEVRWLNPRFHGADYLYNKSLGNKKITVSWMAVFIEYEKDK